jgi:hypothetical protein
MNQVLEDFLRHFCSFYQDDWDLLLPYAQAAVSSRDATSTGVSPFLLSHGYHPRLGDDITLPDDLPKIPRNPQQAAQSILRKIRDTTEFAQVTMAAAQQRQEDITNRRRDPAPTFRVGDKVWLYLKNIRTERPSRKLGEQHAQYTVIGVVDSHAYRLNTPPGIHDVFHVSLLRPVAGNPLPSQVQDDVQPPPIIADDEEAEYDIEEILDDRVAVGRGRGGPLRRQFLVKWRGYATPTWEDANGFEDAVALDRYEEKTGRSNILLEPMVRPPNRGGRG